jgi:hypothetical protein
MEGDMSEEMRLVPLALLSTLRMAAGEAHAWRAETADPDHPEYDDDDAMMAGAYEAAAEDADTIMSAGAFEFADAVKHFAAPKEHWVHAALAENSPAEEGVIEIDDHIVTSDGDEPGTYVMAWTWVEMPDAVESEWRVGLLGEAFTPEEVAVMRENGWSDVEGVGRAHAEGWDIFTTDRDDGLTYELQAIVENGQWASDDQAWQHVYDQAYGGSEYHRRALKALKSLNPDEYRRIITDCRED